MVFLRGYEPQDNINALPMKAAAQIEPWADEGANEEARSGRSKSPPLEIQQELDRILASESFRGSKRCQSFLRYVVEAAYSDGGDELKERTLGITIFGREPNYDTGTDAIVRVKANEVRRRLAQYSLSADPGRPVKISLNPGSYLPQISKAPQPLKQLAQAELKIPRIQSRRLFLIAALLSLVIGLGVGLHLWMAQRSPVLRFWRPLLHQGKPIICVSTPNAYQLAITAPTAIGDSKAAVQVQQALQSLQQPSRVGMVADISEADLKEAPVILIGGPRFNHWNMSMANGFRFCFGLEGHVPVILDRSNPSRHWAFERTVLDGKITKDYVIITRVSRTQYERPMVSIAGLSVYGSRAGGLLLSDSAMLQHILKDAPDGWERKNLQLVLSVMMNHQDVERLDLVASTYW